MASSRKVPKSILRKDHVPTREKGKSATFDEMNIVSTLHPADKDYGFMKVDEPPTPYNREYDPNKEKPVDASLLASKLASVETASTKSPVAPEDNLTPEERERRKEFESKRKAHYNEYKTVKQVPPGVEVKLPKVNLEFCEVEDCPGHEKGSSEKCPIPKGKGYSKKKFGKSTPK